MKYIFRIDEVAKLNQSSITNKDKFELINYLDTSSITKGKIDSWQELKHNYPSRAKRKIKQNTIVYSTVRPNQEHYGFFNSIEKENAIVSTGFATIDVFSDNVEPIFLYYLLTQKWVTNHLHTIAENSVSAYPSINPSDIGNLRFRFPNLTKQKKIANILSDIDNKINLNNQINDNLEHMAKTLYDYWFVQFDFPNENRKPYKSSGGKMIWNEILKREIPEGWKVTVFNDWIEKTKTGDWGKDKIEGNYTEKVYCIRGADINGLNGKGEVKAPQRYILKNNISKALKPDDFIVEISGGSPTQSTGRIALLTESTFERFDSNIICSNFCKAISLKENEFSFNFLQEWQRLYDANVFFGYEGKTSGIKNFLFESFMESYFVIKPPKVLVERFYNQIKNIESKKQSNLKQNQQLSQLRDWLLPMLMNGQVKVE